MASFPPPLAERRRRARRGSLEAPVSSRMYRAAWVLIVLPLLLAAFTVGRPEPLPKPSLPPSFDGATARQLADEFVRLHPSRVPGTPDSIDAARWVAERLQSYNLNVEARSFTAEIPGRGETVLTNLIARPLRIGPERSPESIVVIAGRDNLGRSPGANDNASGTAALIELARNLSTLTVSHTIVFVSTDGSAFGGLGAAQLAADPAFRRDVLAVVNLDSLAGGGEPRLELAGDSPRSPTAVLLATAEAAVFDETDVLPTRPTAFSQLLDLAFPFSFYEQAPFVGHGVSAVTITSSASRPPSQQGDTELDEASLGALGRAAQALIVALDGAAEVARGTDSFLYLGGRFIRGFAIELTLVIALIPFLVATVDLFARLRRRGVLLGPALRSFRSRLALWLWIGALAALFTAFGAFPNGAPRPISPETAPAHTWPFGALLGLLALSTASWFLARIRLVPRRQVERTEELAGHLVAMLALAVVALVLAITNAFTLVFVLPSLHAWLWAPHVRDSNLALRAAVFLLGFAGPGVLLGSFAVRFGFGFDAPWYVATLFSLHYAPTTLFIAFLVWAAVAAQIGVFLFGRYAPYPSPGEGPARGPFREGVRRVVLGVRRTRARRGARAAAESGWTAGESEARRLS